MSSVKPVIRRAFTGLWAGAFAVAIGWLIGVLVVFFALSSGEGKPSWGSDRYGVRGRLSDAFQSPGGRPTDR